MEYGGVKSLLLSSLMLALVCNVCSAKQTLGHEVPPDWPSIEINDADHLSNDGRYVVFFVTTPTSGGRIVVETTDGTWKREILGVSGSGVFTQDSRRMVITHPIEGLGILDLDTDSLRYIQGVEEFHLPAAGDGRWLVYRTKERSTDLTVVDLFSGETQYYKEILTYQFRDDGRVLLLLAGADRSHPGTMTLSWVNLAENKSTANSRGRNPQDLGL